MKLNKKLLQAEINKSKKLMEDISIVNKTDLDKAGHWNVPHIVKTNKGLTAFEKNGYTLIPLNKPIGHKLGGVKGPGDLRTGSQSYKLKDAVYMMQEQADELNLLGGQIQDLIKQYNEKFNQYTQN